MRVTPSHGDAALPEIRSGSGETERSRMTPKREGPTIRSLLAILCTAVLLPGDTLAFLSSPAQAPASSTQTQAAKIPAEQLDSLVAPIALYPDPLLAQTLAASTYPLELIQLQQWLEKNKNLKDKALADAVAKQPWDPSIQALAALAGCGKAAGRRYSVDH